MSKAVPQAHEPHDHTTVAETRQPWQPPVVQRISIREVTKLGLIFGDDLIIIGSGTVT